MGRVTAGGVSSSTSAWIELGWGGFGHGFGLVRVGSIWFLLTALGWD